MASTGESIDTLLIGLDAACLPVLERLFESEAAPALESIFDDGVGGALESQIPPWTASAWPSLYTGVNPGKHGVFGFLRFDDYDWDVVDATHVSELPLWKLLDRHGMSSVVVNVPITHPPREFDGALVPGYVAPADPICRPNGLLAEVREEIGDYRVYPDDAVSDDELLSEYLALARMRGEAFRYLAAEFEPAFGFVQFQVTDTVFHQFPGDFEAVRAVYEAVDEQIARTLDVCDPETVVVASDHGIGRYTEEFRVNEFLRKKGFNRGKRGGEGMPAWAAIRDERLDSSGRDGARDDRGPTDRSSTDRGSTDRSPVERATLTAARTAAKAGITAQSVGSVLEKLGLLEFAMRHVPVEVIRTASEQVDFSASVAYMRDRTECGVRINLEGRESDGVVPQSEYESVQSELISLLADATTADGDPVFEDVAPREAYFHGPRTDDAVDIVTVPRNFTVYLNTWLLDDDFATSSTKWDHKRDGVVAAAGVGIDTDERPANAHIFDVAPTVLATLGVPKSDRMDGRFLSFVEPTGVQRYPRPRPRQERGIDDEVVESKLRRLGYI